MNQKTLSFVVTAVFLVADFADCTTQNVFVFKNVAKIREGRVLLRVLSCISKDGQGWRNMKF
jgi:hypothetical protein